MGIIKQILKIALYLGLGLGSSACKSFSDAALGDRHVSIPHLDEGGSSISIPGGWLKTKLPIKYYIYPEDFNEEQARIICRAIQSWEYLIGLTLFESVNLRPMASTFTRPSKMRVFSFHLANEVLEIRHAFALEDYSSPRTLGHAVLEHNNTAPGGPFIVASDVYLNAFTYRFDGIKNPSYNSRDDRRPIKSLASLITHELGHVLGLGHSQSRGSVMVANSLYGYPPVIPSVNDIQNIHSIYGCHHPACDAKKLRKALIKKRPEFCLSGAQPFRSFFQASDSAAAGSSADTGLPADGISF